MMVIRETPKDIERYIAVTFEQSKILHQNNFIPIYIDDGKVYYKKNNKIVEFLKHIEG